MRALGERGKAEIETHTSRGTGVGLPRLFDTEDPLTILHLIKD